jgi:hypothetical protein
MEEYTEALRDRPQVSTVISDGAVIQELIESDGWKLLAGMAEKELADLVYIRISSSEKNDSVAFLQGFLQGSELFKVTATKAIHDAKNLLESIRRQEEERATNSGYKPFTGGDI